MFYLKLALSNLTKSLKVFGPFVLASTILYSLTCMTMLLLFSPIQDSMPYSAVLFALSLVVLGILSLIMEIYSYNFLLKQRSREFGLYTILGMNRLQVGWLATIELGILFVSVLILGSLFSAIFSQFFYLIFVNLVQLDDLILSLSPLAFLFNTLLFAGIFLVLECVGLLKISQTSPLSLFRTQEKGEKEPKGSRLLAALSILALGLGYYLSITSSKVAALAVLYRFFVAVVFVIIGTYLFYISFMTWYLKKRRNNSKYFYQTNHFVSTSQMIFRMKQHALGLANITILATMAFVTFATTTALYTNSETLAKELFPKNTKIVFNDDQPNKEEVVADLAKRLDKSPQTILAYQSAMLTFPVSTDTDITISQDSITHPNLNTLGYIYMTTQDDFRDLGNDCPNLAENQTAFYIQKGNSHLKTLNIFDQTFDNVVNYKTVIFPDAENTYNSGVLVVSNQTIYDRLRAEFSKAWQNDISNTTVIYLDTSQKDFQTLVGDDQMTLVDTNNQEVVGTEVATKSGFLTSTYSITGGFLFTGFLLGFSFLLCAALIIYYKQGSEGLEDKKSYKILQEVGMTSKQVKKTIDSQVLLVFFMPLALAICHFLAALVMIRQMLMLFGVTSANLVYIISGLTLIAVIVIYFIIYKGTSQTYYKLIKR